MHSQNSKPTNETDKVKGPLCISLNCTICVLGVVALLYTGCAMCCGPYDYHYPTFGGAVQRSDPVWGRVGSIYSDPWQFGGPSADSNLAPKEPGRTNDNLENINGDDSDLQPPEEMIDGDDDSDVLPPPNVERPGPDDDARGIRRLRKQSWQRGYRQQWR